VAAASGPIARIEAAIAFFEKLWELDPLFARLNPIVRRFIEAVKQADCRASCTNT
jgi:hypothetical protein